MIEKINQVINQLRQKKPLILNLTNHVTMDFMANCLLALGAAPIMSICLDELEELIAISSAININIGTLNDTHIERCLAATLLAKKHNKSIVFDPVGAGATDIRTKTAKNLSQHASIIRGNASEIIAIATDIKDTKGVEAANAVEEAKMLAINLANINKQVVVVSGPIDFITNGSMHIEIPYGSPLMSLVTGMGCTLTAVITAFHSVIKNPFEASKLAIYYFTLCGELTAISNNAPGTYKTKFIDSLYLFDFKNLKEIYDSKISLPQGRYL